MTQLDNVNRALAEIGTRSRLTVVDGSTTEGLYASLLYPMLRDAMLRMGDYDWAMANQMTVASIPTPNFPFVYVYFDDIVRIRQAVHSSADDPFDPKPIEWIVLNNGTSRFIGAKDSIEYLVTTINSVPEAQWDAQFTDAFIRYFASAMTMALENRLEASEAILKEALAFAGLANMRTG